MNSFATLAIGRSPNGLIVPRGLRPLRDQVFAYLFLAANPYPPFYVGSDQDTYPVDVVIDPPARQNRWITGFRFVLVIPALLAAAALSGGGASANSRGGTSGGARASRPC